MMVNVCFGEDRIITSKFQVYQKPSFSDRFHHTTSPASDARLVRVWRSPSPGFVEDFVPRPAEPKALAGLADRSGITWT